MKTDITQQQSDKNILFDPMSFVSLAKTKINTSNADFIVEIHTNTIYFRYASNYSTFLTYTSKFTSIAFIPFQNQSQNLGIVLEYDTIDKVYVNGHHNAFRMYNISIINKFGTIIHSNVIDDNVDGTNEFGGSLIGYFVASNTDIQIAIFYIENYQDQNSNIQSTTQVMIFDLTNLALIKLFYMSDAFQSNQNLLVTNSTSNSLIPCIETNEQQNISRASILSNINFGQQVYSSQWFPDSTFQYKLVYNYQNNSYILIKNENPENSSISLIKFTNDCSQILDKYVSAYDVSSINSELLIRKDANNNLSYLIQQNNTALWKNFDNSISSEKQYPDQLVNVTYQNLILYNNDSIYDTMVLFTKNSIIQRMSIFDGKNQSITLFTEDLTNLNLSSLPLIIGKLSDSEPYNTGYFQQLIFLYDSHYFELRNNGTFDSIYARLLSIPGPVINYCSFVEYTIFVIIFPSQNYNASLKSGTTTYLLNNGTNMTFMLSNFNSNGVSYMNFSLDLTTDSNVHLTNTLLLTFQNNYCFMSSYPLFNQSNAIPKFNGDQIPGLPYIISFLFVLIIGVLGFIYYKDHKKI